jgi:hypothetical protein
MIRNAVVFKRRQKNNEGVAIMSEPLTNLLKEISQGSDEMGTYHRKYYDGPKGPEFAELVVELSSGTDYSTTDSATSEEFFKKVDFSGDSATGLGLPAGEHGYESCGHWHTFQSKE